MKHPAMTQKNAETLAEALGKLAKRLPKDFGFVFFLVADVGDNYRAVVTSTMDPEAFAPIMREWLERYDRNECEPSRKLDS
jgi:hypothetical protein